MFTRRYLVPLLLLCSLGSRTVPGATPNFLARRDYLDLYTEYIAVADTNGDGIPDIISDGSPAQVLFGNGNGTFRQGPTINTGMITNFWFVAADVNGDGKVDLVISGSPNDMGYGIGVCLGNGDGTFQPAVYYPAGTNTSTGWLAVGDFNNDGIPDVAEIGTGGVWLFTGKGGGSFNAGVLTPVSGAGPYQLVAADFNGDGNLDVAVTTNYPNGFAVLLGNGNGTFQAPHAVATSQVPAWIAVGDVNLDGNQDVALSFFSSAYVSLYLGNGAGGFASPNYVYLAFFNGVSIGDLNGDGIPDLVNSEGYIAFGNGNGTFKPPVHFPVQSSIFATATVLADLRNNGLTDIVTDSQLGVSVLLSQGKGRFLDGGWTPVTGGAACGAAADFNGDGKPDLAVTTSAGVSILLGTGKISPPFATGTPIAVTGAACVVSGDLNGDGIPDLLVAVNGSPNALLSYLGKGDGTFTLKGTTPTPNSGGYVVLADFNNDGKLDFATSGNLLALGNGDGTFQTPVAFVPNVLPATAASGFTNIATGDVNGDGWPDLVLTDFKNYYIYVLLNNQHGGFNQSVINTTSQRAPAQVVLADLNKDGKLDMVTGEFGGAGAGAGAIVYLGNGKGGFTYTSTLIIPQYPADPIAIADVNGDGIPDIAMLTSGTIGIFLGKGNGTFQSPFYIGTGPSPNDILVENLHGQSSSAGLPDIVVPDSSGGVTVLINKTK